MGSAAMLSKVKDVLVDHRVSTGVAGTALVLGAVTGVAVAAPGGEAPREQVRIAQVAEEPAPAPVLEPAPEQLLEQAPTPTETASPEPVSEPVREPEPVLEVATEPVREPAPRPAAQPVVVQEAPAEPVPGPPAASTVVDVPEPAEQPAPTEAPAPTGDAANSPKTWVGQQLDAPTATAPGEIPPPAQF